ncbi:MAG: sensor domain-containing diguanylate cyclase [Thermoleophilia bacterium]
MKLLPKRNSRAARDLLIIAILSVAVFTLSYAFELFERFVDFAGKHEYTQLNDIMSVIVFLMIAFMVFAFRRWGEAEKEKQQRGHAERQALARNLELSSLYEITSAIGRTMEMRELFSAVLDKIVNLGMLGVDFIGGVAFVSEEGRLKLLANEGVTGKFLELHEDIRPGQCLCGLCAESGEMMTSEDCDEDDRHSIIDPSIPRHGHVIVPLKAKDRVEGILALYTEPGVKVETGVIQLLGYIGNQMGIALENLKLYERTRQMSLHDPLTGLANRRLLFNELEQMFAGARRHGRPLSVIMMDLDHFKDYNDAHGHAAGDRVLSGVASIVRKLTRAEDVAARYGGEEFLLVLPEADSKWAAAIAERIRRDVESAGFATEEEKTGFSRITLSLGIASLIPGIEGGDALIGLADRALYEAKRKGRNRVEIYHQDDAAAAS